METTINMEYVIGFSDWMEADTIGANLMLTPMDWLQSLTQGIANQIPAKPKTVQPITTAQQQQTANILNYVYSQANLMQSLLSALPEPARSYGVYATYYESAAYTSPLYKQHNNATGIKYAKQKGATQGANDYAYFDTWQNWAAAYVHELTKGSNPSGAQSIEDFATRLKANKYYEDSYSNYVAGLQRARYVLKDLPATMRAGLAPDGTFQNKNDLDIPGSTDYSKGSNWWKNLPDWEKGGIVGGGILLLIVALRS